MKKFSVLLLTLVFVLAMASTAFAASYNNTTNFVDATAYGHATDLSDTLATFDTDNDNNVKNANDTGTGVGGQAANFNQVIKSDNMTWADPVKGFQSGQTQRTHGEYQNNTNSCASCHQTHTAAARDLLFKSSVYNTCTACHDGTLGKFDVFNPSTAGTFGGTKDGNASMHLATGDVEIKAAPGGNKNADTEGGWSNSFACNSCHTPHGAYSSRLLHFDPNGMADVPSDEGGTKVVTDNIYTAADLAGLDASVTTAVVVDTYANVVALGATGPYASNNILFQAGNGGVTITGDVAVVVVKGKTGWDVDTTPWFYEYEFNSSHTSRLWATGFWKDSAANQTMANISKESPNITGAPTIDHQNAFAYGDFTGYLSAGLARVYVTKLPVDANTGVMDATWYTNTGVSAGSGVAVSKFCAACHTDYLTAASASGTSMWGSETAAYRHTTNSDTYMCLRCHFAHGTDVTVMKDSMDRDLATAATQLFGGDTDQAKAYLLDQNPDSALKRYTNMAVCWKCHTSSHSAGFRNTDYFKTYGKTSGQATSIIPNGFPK